MKRKLLFGVFAHPDDEAFGPSGYLYRQAHNGVEVHLIMVTDGSEGRNEGFKHLKQKRHEEWMESGRRIGASSNMSLGYKDGAICNNLYLEIANKIIKHIKQIVARNQAGDEITIEMITFDQSGLSGHVDHIAVSYITTYVYEKLKKSDLKNTKFNRLLYYCLCDKIQSNDNFDWLYMPRGISEEEADYIHDFSDIAEEKFHIMFAHESQKEDLDNIILPMHDDKVHGPVCRREFFKVRL